VVRWTVLCCCGAGCRGGPWAASEAVRGAGTSAGVARGPRPQAGRGAPGRPGGYAGAHPPGPVRSGRRAPRALPDPEDPAAGRERRCGRRHRARLPDGPGVPARAPGQEPRAHRPCRTGRSGPPRTPGLPRPGRSRTPSRPGRAPPGFRPARPSPRTGRTSLTNEPAVRPRRRVRFPGSGHGPRSPHRGGAAVGPGNTPEPGASGRPVSPAGGRSGRSGRSRDRCPPEREPRRAARPVPVPLSGRPCRRAG
jgi:hypothetical protein